MPHSSGSPAREGTFTSSMLSPSSLLLLSPIKGSLIKDLWRLRAFPANTCSGMVHVGRSTLVGSSSAVPHSTSPSRQVVECCQLTLRGGCAQPVVCFQLGIYNPEPTGRVRWDSATSSSKAKPQARIPAVLSSSGVMLSPWSQKETRRLRWEQENPSVLE